MLSDRQSQIINYLSKQQIPIAAKKIAAFLNVSEKTIRNDISFINQEFNKNAISSKSGSGYFINELPNNSTILQNDNTIFLILKEIIDSQKLNYYDLAEKFYISETTLDRYIKELNTKITKIDTTLCIIRRNNYLYINATEEQKRNIFNFFLKEEISKNKLELAQYSDYFQNIDFNRLSQLVLSYHHSINYHMNDFANISFILHLAVLLERIIEKNTVSKTNAANFDIHSLKSQTKELIPLLEANFDLKIPENEIKYIDKLYNLSTANHQYTEEITKTITKVLQKIKGSFYIDFSTDKDLINFLSNHVESLYHRAQKKSFLVNPLLDDIKRIYPFIYNIAVFASFYIQESLSIVYPDDEIAFIALHFLSSYENINKLETKSIAVVSAYGQANTSLVRKQLRNINDYQIEVQEFTSTLEFSNKQMTQFDLIISDTILDISETIPIYYFYISLTPVDLENINKLLKKQEIKLSKTAEFIKPELFFTNLSFQDKYECISFLASNMIDKGFCEANFLADVIEREKLSSTAFGNYYALPHAIRRTSNANYIAICILNEPLMWDRKKVYLVLLMSFNGNKSLKLNTLFEELAFILDDIKNVKKLIKCQNYQQFIQQLNHLAISQNK